MCSFIPGPWHSKNPGHWVVGSYHGATHQWAQSICREGTMLSFLHSTDAAIGLLPHWDLQLSVLHGERCGTPAVRFLMALMISGQSKHLNSCLSKMVPGSRKREPITAASCVPLQTDRAARELWHRKTWVKRMQTAVYSFPPTFQQGDHL